MSPASFMTNFILKPGGGAIPWDTPTSWAVLERTPIGRMVRLLILEWQKVVACNDNLQEVDTAFYWLDHLFIASTLLANGNELPPGDRRLIYKMAWDNRKLLPPDLVFYAALGGGITCEE
jgi:hypothetical protein